MPDILLTTLNVRYIHSAFGLRYLLANLGDLQARACLLEFTLAQRPLDIVEQLLALNPRIIGFGAYIWNVREINEIVALLKQIAPQVQVVLGGPEVSFETAQQSLAERADYVITGAADLAFAQLCRALLAEQPPAQKIIHAEFVPLAELALPYDAYTDEDIAQRIIYVEASRGCPFRCEFCLSALDKTAYAFDLYRFLAEMAKLWERGARRFKFVDRTFNLKTEQSAKILTFFLQRLDAQTFLHFELIPDNLPDALKTLIQQFPPGSLQFEIGIQSFNPDVQARISRRQDTAKTNANLRFLREQTHAHLHTDLLAGLPGEDLASFAQGFDDLVALNPHEIQLGILKRLRGAPISRHSQAWDMRYSPLPPYPILSNKSISFKEMQRISRFARYWDLFMNSGRFPQARRLLLGEQPFMRFMAFSDWLYAQSGQTHQIALDKLFDWLYRGLTEVLAIEAHDARQALLEDFELNQVPKRPACLREADGGKSQVGQKVHQSAKARQIQHLKGVDTE